MPALAEALRDAHERRYAVLLCWALDRLSRGGTGALGLDGTTTCHGQAYMDATNGQSTTTNCN